MTLDSAILHLLVPPARWLVIAAAVVFLLGAEFNIEVKHRVRGNSHD